MHTTINKNIYIVSKVWNRGRNAWGHESIAYYKGFEIAKNRVRYYNRTWEGYRFATCMMGLVHKMDKTKEIPLAERIEAYRMIRNGSGW